MIFNTNINLAPLPSALGDITSPTNGDIWYNGNTNKFRARENGSTVDLISAGGGLSPIANNNVLGNVSGSTATPVAITATQLTTLVNTFTTSLSGAVPAASGGSTTTQFLRKDGTWVDPTSIDSTFAPSKVYMNTFFS